MNMALQTTPTDLLQAPEQPCLSSSGQLDTAASSETIDLTGQSCAGARTIQSGIGTQQLSLHDDTETCTGERSQWEAQDAVHLQPTASTAIAAGPLAAELSVSFLPVDRSTSSPDLSISDSFQQQQPRRSSLNHSSGTAALPPVPAINAHAAALLVAADPPWTQNTARALRRAQHEVVDIFAAQGLPPPSERGYCFDLVGTRAAGPSHTPAALQSKHDWLVVEEVATTKGLASQYTSSSGVTSHHSSISGGRHRLASTQGCISITQSSRGRASFRCASPAGIDLSSPSTPTATGTDLLLMLQQRRGHISAAEEASPAQRPASAPSSLGRRQHAQQHQSSRLMATGQGKQQWDDLFARHHKQQMFNDTSLYLSSTSPGNLSTPHQQLLRHSSHKQHGKQIWDDLFTKHHLKQQQQLSGVAREHSRKPTASRSRSTSPLQCSIAPNSGATPLDAGVIARAERSIALHALIAGKAGGIQACTLPEAPWEQQQCNKNDSRQDSSTAAFRQCRMGECQNCSSAELVLRPVVPDKWWTMADKAVNDPLLLTLPVWMRDALDLELMPS